jgi:hypothetical protein
MKINRGYTRSVRLSISDDRGAIFGAGNVHSGFLMGLGILGDFVLGTRGNLQLKLKVHWYNLTRFVLV